MVKDAVASQKKELRSQIETLRQQINEKDEKLDSIQSRFSGQNLAGRVTGAESVEADTSTQDAMVVVMAVLMAIMVIIALCLCIQIRSQRKARREDAEKLRQGMRKTVDLSETDQEAKKAPGKNYSATFAAPGAPAGSKLRQ